MVPIMIAAVYALLCVGALVWAILGKDRMFTDVISGYGAVVGFAVTGAYFEANLVYDVVGGVIHPLEAQSIGYLLYAFSFVSFCILLSKLYQLINEYFEVSDNAAKQRAASAFDFENSDVPTRSIGGIPISSIIMLIVADVIVLISGVFVQAIFTAISTESADATIELQIQVFKIISTVSSIVTMLLTLAVFVGGFYIMRKVATSTSA